MDPFLSAIWLLAAQRDQHLSERQKQADYVKVTMKTSGANVPRPTNFTQPMFSPKEPEVVELVASALFTRIIFFYGNPGR